MPTFGNIIDYADHMGISLKERMRLMTSAEREEVLSSLSEDMIIQMARDEWWFTQRPEQVPPKGNWTVHLYLAGRGAGKTKSGAEWLVERTLDYPYDTSGFPTERLVMAYNLSDTRTTCIEGPSGILRVLERRGLRQGIDFFYVRSPKPRIVITETQAKIHFTGASSDAARGLNLADAWLDEPIKWDDPEQVWKEGIYPALRADIPGDRPRVFVTTTPKPISILKLWSKRTDGFVSMVRGSTYDNAANLSTDFITEIKREYEGTSIGRQEIDGELLDDMDGPLFSQEWINKNRAEKAPDVVSHTVVGVDPCLTGAEDGDLMGVVVVARGLDDHMYVLEDASIKLTGGEAARHAWIVFARHKADVLVVEDNLGKQWLVKVLTDTYLEMVQEGFFPANTKPPIKTVHSNHGKKLRAEPVALRYEQNRVHHIGKFEKLEDEQVGWDPTSSKESPDRLDALVHACRHLMAGEKKNVRFFSPHRIQVAGL